ncbi:Uncharacterized protein FWK35_00033648, partial [Aphis craccivora]
MKIDNKHIGILSNWLNIHSPFPELHEIMSISTGVVGNEQINCYQAQEVGQQTMKNVIGDNFSDIKFQRSNRVVSLDFAKKLTVCIRDEILSIDPLLLFQRIMIRVKTEEELKECQMRKTKKSILYDVFPSTTNTYNVLDKNVVVVIDGGFLLHRVVWPSTSTYGNIIENYANYVKRHYGSNCVVVFDGYANTELNIKNSERQRRKNMYTSTNIIFEELMDVLTTQEKFLSNTENKMRLITMLTEKFLTSGILVRQAEDDADLLIVNIAIRNTDDNVQVVVIGKIKHLKIVQKHPELHDSLLIFNNESSSLEEIERAGEKYLLTLYKAPAHITSLNKLRHDVFQKTAASNKKKVQLARLPPTIDAKEYNGKLNPVFTKNSPAPDTLLNVISCACTKTCEQYCSCRKAGLLCSVICKHCQGGSCLNQQPIIDDEEEDNFEDYIDEINLIENQKEETHTPTIKKIDPHNLINKDLQPH